MGTHVNKQQPLNKNFSNQSSRHQSSEHKSTHSSSIFSPSNNSRESNSQRTSGKNSPNGSQNSSSGIVHNGQGSQLTSNNSNSINSNSINSNNMNHNQFLPKTYDSIHRDLNMNSTDSGMIRSDAGSFMNNSCSRSMSQNKNFSRINNDSNFSIFDQTNENDELCLTFNVGGAGKRNSIDEFY